MRVPPKLMAPQRRTGRARGKSDPIDALAVARAALREPQLNHPRPGEPATRELKLLVDHRDDLVDERRRAQQRLRWQLHDLDPDLVVPAGALDRTVWLDRVARRLSRGREDGAGADRARARRPLPHPDPHDPRPRPRTRQADRTDRPDAARAARLRPLSAAKLLGEIGPIERFDTDAQLARHAGVAPLEASSGKYQRHRLDRGGNRQLNCALHRIAITQSRVHPPHAPTSNANKQKARARREAIRCLKRQLATHRLHHTQERAAIDIGATLAQPSELHHLLGDADQAAHTSRDVRRRSPRSRSTGSCPTSFTERPSSRASRLRSE